MARIKEYLSYSQYEAIRQGRNNYKRIYIENIKRESKYLDFGRKIAEGLQFRHRKTTDKDILVARKLIRKPQWAEKVFKVVWGGIPLLSQLDGFSASKEGIYLIDENKTGKNGWKQSDADRAAQITFYTAVICQHYKIKPEQIKSKLNYLESYEDTDGQIHLTGFIKTFETKRTSGELLKFFLELKWAWAEIEDLINENL